MAATRLLKKPTQKHGVGVRVALTGLRQIPNPNAVMVKIIPALVLITCLTTSVTPTVSFFQSAYSPTGLSFGKPMNVSSDRQLPAESTNGKVQKAEIVFADSGKTLTWRDSDGSILEFAEANDINPPYSCRAGICGTCACKIREGEVA